MVLTSDPKKMILFLLLILASLSAAFPTPVSTLSEYSAALTEEQLLVGFELVKDLLPSGLDVQAVIYRIKTGAELDLTSSQVHEMQAIEEMQAMEERKRSYSAPRGITDPCLQGVVIVCVDAIGFLASFYGIAIRAEGVANSINLSPHEASSLFGLVQTISSSAASSWNRATSVWSLIAGIINMRGIKTLILSMTMDLSYDAKIKAVVVISAQLAIWFGSDGLAFFAQALLGINAFTALVQDTISFAHCNDPKPISGTLTQLTVTVNAGGDFELFAIDESQVPYRRSVTSDGFWADWQRFPGLVSQIAAAQNQDGTVQVFGIATNGGLVFIRQDRNSPNGWQQDWVHLGGGMSEIRVGTNADGRLEVFVIGGRGQPYHIWQTAPNGGWSGWATLGGSGAGRVLSVSQTPSGALESFCIGGDGALFVSRQVSSGSSSWTSWNRLGGGVLTAQTAVLNADGRVEVFAINSDKMASHIWQNAQNPDSWWKWESLSTSTLPVQQLAAAQLSSTKLIVFGIGLDQTVSYTVQDSAVAGGWADWKNLGGSATKISLVMDKYQCLRIFAIFSDKNIYVAHQLNTSDPTKWSNWVPLD